MSIYRMATVNTPSDSYTKLLMHFDGANNSTVFTDVIGKTLTPYGNAKISTAQSKFGGASGLLDGNTSYVSSPNSEDFEFRASDFTIEFWLNSNVAWSSQPWSSAICGQKQGDATNGWVIYRDNNYPTKINARIGLQNNFPTSSTPTQGVWEHWALVRSGTVLKWYKNGVLDATGTSSVDVNDTTGRFLVGLADSWSNSYLNACIDELRISKGIARYTVNFTPDTSPFNTTFTPTNANVIIKDIYRGYGGVNRIAKELCRSHAGVNRKIFNKAYVIYDNGIENVPLWTAVGMYGDGVVTKLSNAIKITGGVNANTLITTTDTINMTPYTYLCATVMIKTATNDMYDEFSLYIKDRWANGFNSNSDAMGNDVTNLKSLKMTTKGSQQTFILDIRGISSTNVFALCTWYVAEGYIYKIWLEV